MIWFTIGLEISYLICKHSIHFFKRIKGHGLLVYNFIDFTYCAFSNFWLNLVIGRTFVSDIVLMSLLDAILVISWFIGKITIADIHLKIIWRSILREIGSLQILHGVNVRTSSCLKEKENLGSFENKNTNQRIKELLKVLTSVVFCMSPDIVRFFWDIFIVCLPTDFSESYADMLTSFENFN